MSDEIPIILDDQPVTARPGETLWQVARRCGREIPRLCLSTEPDFRPDGNCRVCMVEIAGERVLAPSCATQAAPGMRIMSQSARAVHARRLVMELLLAEASIHPESECARQGRAMGVTQSRFPGADTVPTDDSHPGIAVDLAACIHCVRCIQACREVELYDVIGLAKRGERTKIVFDADDPMGDSSCVSCGSCAQTCPTGALTFRRIA